MFQSQQVDMIKNYVVGKQLNNYFNFLLKNIKMFGFELTRFVNVAVDLLEDYQCSICHGVFNIPTMMTCCKVMFCQGCITQWLETGTNCPCCRSTFRSTTNVPLLITNKIGDLTLTCKYQDKGCDKILKICDLSEHQESCQYQYCKTCLLEYCNGDNCIETLKLVNRLQREEIIKMKNKISSLNENVRIFKIEIDNLKRKSTSLFNQSVGFSFVCNLLITLTLITIDISIYYELSQVYLIVIYTGFIIIISSLFTSIDKQLGQFIFVTLIPFYLIIILNYFALTMTTRLCLQSLTFIFTYGFILTTTG